MTTSSYTTTLMALRDQLPHTRFADRPRLSRELDRLFARRTPPAQADAAVEKLSQAIAASVAHVERLKSLPLRLDYDPALPISAHRDEIAKALQTNQVAVVCGATGSGKTTQLPKICMEAGRGTFGMIGHTQPRRIAARAIANRLAEELRTTVGGAVGYQVRFNDRTGPDCRVKLMTDGILLRELENDRLLRRYDTLIIDEAHERSLNIDFLLGVLKRLLPQRPELRVVITSATIDPQRFAEFFGGAPIIEVSGRSYPVEVRYRPLTGTDEDDYELSLDEGIVAAVQELEREDRGDVLVFLPGEKQIRDAADALSKAKLRNTEVLPLYARLSTRDQEKIFEKHGSRRVVLATNVAETSLTVPGVRHVVDSGLARISRYSVRGKVQRLPIEPISQASADQRKGRSGREAPGICIRLYAEDDFNLRPAFTPPEVLRTNLASVILQMAALELGEPEEFPFVDPPDTRLINDGYRLLQELKAVDDNRRVTSVGRQLSSLPVDPRLGRMLLAASHHGCLAEMLVIAAFLSAQDPRERPSDAQAQADQKHAAFADPRSDFIAILNLWNAYTTQVAELSGNQLRKWCRENFIAFMRAREWQELHRQLSETVKELGLKPNTTPADYANLHQAILTGFLGNIGALDEKREYDGARGSRFVIAPGTPLASKPPKWVVAANLMETTRLYARTVAAVEPQWIESAGAHLIKRSYSEPHWVEDRGFVAAFESVALYGLTLSSRRRINLGNVSPREAQEIFVREALVEERSRLKAEFLKHNRRLRRQVEVMEAKVRRRDILADEQALCDFYLSRLPPHVNSVSALEKWLKTPGHAQQLHMTMADITRRDASEITPQEFPPVLAVTGNELPLEYRFEPGAASDGVTVVLPKPLLINAVAGDFSRPIPGWRVETITQMLRSLPKQIRKAFVPVPEHAARAAAEIDESKEFNAAVAEWITRVGGTPVTAEEVAALPLPDHLRVNFRVADLDGKTLAEGRDLIALKRTVREREAQSQAKGGGPRPAEKGTIHRRWNFGDLAIEESVQRRGLRFSVYPTLRDKGEGVEVTEAATLVDAEGMLRAGVLRLAILALPEQFKYARKRCSERTELMLLAQGLNNSRPIAEALAEKCFVECFLGEDSQLPRSTAQFDALLDRHRARFGEVTDKVIEHTTSALRELRNARLKLAALEGPTFQALRTDVNAQLQMLVPGDFPASVPTALWPHLPRYFRALTRRLDKAPGNQKRDAELLKQVSPATQVYQRLLALAPRGETHPELDRLQWMIEEFRVSLFAQDLKAALPVSDKRIADQIERARVEVQRAA
ncbi:MAG TPA: ATP-dependent RNA helicase HrpA [Steroidobacter sp.]|uniref:ATP-dependent RNA helicase HrpA n=1 Tax=Steroidobacter sp. TaxID=1978227 RepID=UPI002EDA634A